MVAIRQAIIEIRVVVILVEVVHIMLEKFLNLMIKPIVRLLE